MTKNLSIRYLLLRLNYLQFQQLTGNLWMTVLRRGFFILQFLFGVGVYIFDLIVSPNKVSMLMYLTKQTYLLFAIISAINFLKQVCKKKVKWASLQFRNNIFQITLVASIWVTIVYWPVLHQSVMDDPVYGNSNSLIAITYLSHSAPLIFLTIQLFMTQARFQAKGWKYVFIYWIIGSSLNFIFSVTLGPVYFFLDYKDIKSTYILLIVLVVNTIFFFICNLIARARDNIKVYKKKGQIKKQ